MIVLFFCIYMRTAGSMSFHDVDNILGNNKLLPFLTYTIIKINIKMEWLKNVVHVQQAHNFLFRKVQTTASGQIFK